MKELSYYELLNMNNEKVSVHDKNKSNYPFTCKINLKGNCYTDIPVISCMDNDEKFWYLRRVEEGKIKVYQYIEEDKESEQTITIKEEINPQNQYKFWEIFKLYEEKIINDDAIIVNPKTDEECTVKKLINMNEDAINFRCYIKQSKEKKVTFEEILNTEKIKCRVELEGILDDFNVTKDYYWNFSELMRRLGEEFGSGELKNIIKNGKWYTQL